MSIAAAGGAEVVTRFIGHAYVVLSALLASPFFVVGAVLLLLAFAACSSPFN